MDSKRYTSERYRQTYNAGIFGVLLSIGLNAVIVCACHFNGLKYIYPPPEEKTLLVEFEQRDFPEIKLKKYGREPSAEDPEPEKTVEYVQKSQAQNKGVKQNQAREATVGKDGDVDVAEPEREEEIDTRALFHAAKNSDKDTLAAQTAREVSDALKAGHAKGNIEKGGLDGTPSARVEGRTTVGIPAKPGYNVQNEGTVVVEIWVDRMGMVVRAIPGVEGTTVTDSEMWKAAAQAAFKTRFNQNPESPEQMKGTITYIFKLK